MAGERLYDMPPKRAFVRHRRYVFSGWQGFSRLGDAHRQKAQVYWYPGAGRDLTPLLLLPERSVFCRQGFQPDRETDASPLLLWLTDLQPVENLVQSRGDVAYESLWRRLQAQCRIVEKAPLDMGRGQPEGLHYVLDAEIVRANEPMQRFRFIYSQARAEAFPEFFARRQLDVSWVAFIRATGGFGGPRAQALMALFAEHLPELAMPEALIADHCFADTNGFPGYLRLGSREPEWMPKILLRAENRMKTRGVSDWSWRARGADGHVALWAREDRYDAFMSMVRAGS